MTYTVYFQNTGNDTSYHVFILDTLDADMDISSFQPIASSHQMQSEILPGDILRFYFRDIMLVDSNTNEPLSHGWVTYRASAKAGLTQGTQLTNKAGIYFDFNPPVITNTMLNTIDIFLGYRGMYTVYSIVFR